ncbi:MAG: ABC transporter substrate-binding protein [Pseudomonadota bacterium]|nr:ABC transporter substrate-binding protein [Pseudomonadota bacterium]
MTRSWMLLTLALFALPATAANLRYAEDQAPAIVNPLFGSTMAEARVNELLFDGLYTDNQDLATTPALAASGELSPDKTEMTITLRDDVTWQDGKPFVANDVVFTIQAMQDKTTLSTEAGRAAFIKTATALDEHTVKLKFARPESRPEDKLLFKILPAHAFAGTSVKRTDGFRNKPVGTGPWELVKYNEDNSVSFTTNGSYRTPVGLSEMTMREVSDKNYQAKLLLYESLEALVRVLPRDLAMLQNNRKVELYPYQTNSWWYVGFNATHAPYDDVNVRKAMSALVDVPSLLAPVGTGDLLSGPFVKSSPYYNHDVNPVANDENAAETLFAAAGYTKVGGAWSKGGKPLTVRIAAHQSLESAQEVAINLQSQLQSAGLTVNVEFLDDAAWKGRVWREHDFDLILSQWTFDRNEDVREQFHSQGARNFTGYKNPEVDALLDKARDAADPFVRKTALREVHKRVHDDAPMVFLWTLDSYAAMSVKVKNVVIHPFYFFTFATGWQMK